MTLSRAFVIVNVTAVPLCRMKRKWKKKPVLWNSQEECTVFCTGKHNVCHLKDHLCLLCIFPREFECYWKSFISPTVFVWQNFLKFSFNDFFCHATRMGLNIAEAHYYILNIVWAWWKRNHNKDSRHVSPITDSQTVQVQTCTCTFGHETNSKHCLRNTALPVVCRTALW